MTLLFSLCEGAAATSTSPWHIRPLERSPVLRRSGGIDTDSLCARVTAPYGWDLFPLEGRHTEDKVCAVCRDRYEDYLRVGELYYEHEGKKYVRMRDVSGLEKQ